MSWSDVLPWPSSADGGGDSLVRIDPTASGTQADSWVAATPTPQAVDMPNATVRFSVERGWYSGSQTVALTATIPGATIRYNTTGSGSVSQTYTGPITVTSGSELKVIQAAAVVSGQQGPIVTHSYVFKADQGIPVVALWPNGRAVAPGKTEETKSFEFIPPPSTGLAAVGADSGVKPSAGGVDAGDSDKVFFRSAYGAGTLRADLFSDHYYGLEPVAQIDQLFLRNEHLDGTHLRQIIAQDALLATGQLSPHGRFVEYYKEGTDEGIRHLQERPEGGFMEAYTGIDKSEWRAWSSHESSPGTGTSNGLGAETLGAPFASWADVEQRINVQALVDYQLVQWQAKVSDYRNIKNFRIAGPFNNGDGDGDEYRFRFFNWDMDLGYNNDRYGRGGPTGWGWAGYVSPDYLLHELDGFVELGLLASDRIVCAYFDDGPLTPTAFAPRLDARRAELVAAGGVNETSFISGLETWIGQRNTWLINEYRSPGAGRTVYGSFRPDQAPWKPPTSFAGPLLGDRDPVDVSVTDGVLAISNQGSFAVWYRLDGGDPRTATGTLAPEAIEYTGPVALPVGNQRIIARSFDSNQSLAVDQWSPACNEPETFEVTQPPGPYEPGLILNEWNAVSSDALLPGSDPYFGPILGNGGDWFEVVVVQDNLDVRGWQLEISDAESGVLEETDTFVFSDDLLLANLRAGTILTISEDLADDVSFSPETGDWWINLQSESGDAGGYFTPDSQSNFDTNNDDWQLRVLDASGAVRFGPAGEGVAGLSGVGSAEIGELEADPSPTIDGASAYDDGDDSTFGAPNGFDAGFQDFAALRSWFVNPADNEAPQTIVEQPGAGEIVADPAVVVSGAATDNNDVARVRLALVDVATGEFLQADGTFSDQRLFQDAVLASPGATSTSWTFAANLADGTYRVIAKADDQAGNVEAAVRLTFSVATATADTDAPQSTIDAPTDGEVIAQGNVDITGTAVDNVDVTRVRVAVVNVTTGEFRQDDGSFAPGRFFADASLDAPNSATTGWLLATNLSDGRYRAIVRAQDSADNVETAIRQTFEVATVAPDITAPTSTIDSVSDVPVGAAIFGGDASDDVAVRVVRVSFRNRDNGLWLQADGTLGASFYGFVAVLNSPGASTTDWSVAVNLPEAGRYRMVAKAIDTSSNIQSPTTVVDFEAV